MKKLCYRVWMIEWLILKNNMERKELGKIYVMIFTREPSPVHVVIDQRKLNNVEYFKDLGKLTKNDATLYVKMILGLPCKISIQQEKCAFCRTLNINCKDESSKVMHLGHRYFLFWNWTFREADHTFMEGLKCGAGEGWWRSVGLNVWEMRKYYNR